MDLEPSRTATRIRRAGPLIALAALVVAFASAGPAAAAVPASFFGMTAVSPTGADFERIAATGAGSYRVEINWRGAQTERDGPLNWRQPDARFREAAASGLAPLPLLFGTPSFVAPDPGRLKPPVRSRRDRREWQRFVAAAVERYGPGGSFWGQNQDLDPDLAPEDWMIWNEQNARAFWRPGADPREYASLLRVSQRAIEGEDPDAKLIAGGMYGYPGHAKSIEMETFLRRLYRQRGAREAIDAISLHPYARSLRGVTEQLKRGRRIVRRAGDADADLWVGEIGWASAGNRRSFLVKSERRQARLLERSYKLLLRKRRRWNVRAAFWFTWRDYREDAICSWCPRAGLLSRRGEAKPAYEAFTRLVARRT